jgi:predicted nucleic acid-binding protein
MVIDDGVPRKIANDENLRFRGTLGLLCEAIREDQLTVGMVERLADDLLIGTYYLPFKRGGFREWAAGQGLIS